MGINWNSLTSQGVLIQEKKLPSAYEPVKYENDEHYRKAQKEINNSVFRTWFELQAEIRHRGHTD